MNAERGAATPNFLVVVPARLGSTRLPRKPLADLGGLPMVVRVARQAARSSAARVVVAADAEETVDVCRRHGVEALLTRVDHASGSDRLAEVCERIGLADSDIVVNVQGDEPLIAPSLIDAVARRLADDSDCAVATAAHPVGSVAELTDPNAVKVVIDARGHALYFSRAPVPWWRDGWSAGIGALPDPAPLRHVGLYAYRAGFLRAFPALAAAPVEAQESLEQLRILWHGFRIAVHRAADAPAAGVDTAADLERVRAHFAAERNGASGVPS